MKALASLWTWVAISNFIFECGADTSNDPYDLSFIKKWAAIGDSYAAGIGSGNQLDKSCYRYDAAYPNIININLNEDTKNITFDFRACSGAKTPDTIKQAKALDGNQQMITISSGGNDAGLIDVLNACVYTFYGLISGDCDKALSKSQSAIESDEFTSNVQTLINVAKTKLTSDGTIFYTGYAKFFDNSTDTCDTVSWHVWANLWSKQFLTQDRRQQMNDLVDAMNSKLNEIIGTADDQVELVDYDVYLDETNGRFCAPYTDESAGNGANRIGLFFYQTKTQDSPVLPIGYDPGPSHDELKRRDDGDSADTDEEEENSQMDDWLMEALENDPTAQLNDDVVSSDLATAVDDERDTVKRRLRERSEKMELIAWASRALSHPTKRSVDYDPRADWIQQVLMEDPDARLVEDLQDTEFGAYVEAVRKEIKENSIGKRSTSWNSHRLVIRGASGWNKSTPITPTASWTPLLSSVFIRSEVSSDQVGRSCNVQESNSRISSGILPSATTVNSQQGNGSCNSEIDNSTQSSSSTAIASARNMTIASNSNATTILASNFTGVLANNPTAFPSKNWTTTSANSSASISGNKTVSLSNGTSTFTNSTSNGTVIINGKTSVFSYWVPVSMKRVFHPKQNAHMLIANLVMYRMFLRRSKALGIGDYSTASEISYIGNGSCPIIPSPVCTGLSSNTWTTRDSVVSAVSSFCNDPNNLHGNAGDLTSQIFNAGSLNAVNISIEWTGSSGIAQISCNTYFDTLVDSCDIPSSSSNSENSKHGGSIVYNDNATLIITPLGMQREWDKGQPTYHQCSGTDTNHYLEQSVLASNIADFCTASAQNNLADSGFTFSKSYNDNTPGAVTLTTTWPTSSLVFEIFEDECNYYMNTIMNGCDVPSGDINPMNWKHGGSMADHNNIQYTITPTINRPDAPSAPIASCSQAHFNLDLYYTVSVSGGGWMDSNGDGALKKQIKGCGALTSWKFEYNSVLTTGAYEWQASGHLPLTSKPGCVGRAVRSSGGPSGAC